MYGIRHIYFSTVPHHPTHDLRGKITIYHDDAMNDYQSRVLSQIEVIITIIRDDHDVEN